MASGKSNYLKNKELNYNFNGGAIHAQPSSIWIRLYTTPLTAGGAGTEVAAPSYDPVEFVCSTANFPTTADGSMENAVQKSVGVAAEDWGEVVAWGAWDAETGGHLLYWGDIDPGIDVVSGAVMVIPVGMLSIASEDEA